MLIISCFLFPLPLELVSQCMIQFNHLAVLFLEGFWCAFKASSSSNVFSSVCSAVFCGLKFGASSTMLFRDRIIRRQTFHLETGPTPQSVIFIIILAAAFAVVFPFGSTMLLSILHCKCSIFSQRAKIFFGIITSGEFQFLWFVLEVTSRSEWRLTILSQIKTSFVNVTLSFCNSLSPNHPKSRWTTKDGVRWSFQLIPVVRQSILRWNNNLANTTTHFDSAPIVICCCFLNLTNCIRWFFFPLIRFAQHAWLQLSNVQNCFNISFRCFCDLKLTQQPLRMLSFNFQFVQQRHCSSTFLEAFPPNNKSFFGRFKCVHFSNLIGFSNSLF